LKPELLKLIGERAHLGAPNLHVPNFIGGSEESAVGWKSHWPDPIRMSGECPRIRLWSIDLQVPNQQFALLTAAALKWNELTNKTTKREMNEPGDPPTCCSCLNSPMPIHRNESGPTALECDDWLLLIHRPNLSNAKD
jgi:hypothetical protein